LKKINLSTYLQAGHFLRVFRWRTFVKLFKTHLAFRKRGFNLALRLAAVVAAVLAMAKRFRFILIGGKGVII